MLIDDSIRKRRPEDGPPPAETPAFTEAELIAIDVSYADLKAHGYLHRIEADRALAIQIERQGAANFTSTGLWG